MTIPTMNYLRLGFARGGRERPSVDCWGLYRLVVGECHGVWLEAFSGIESNNAVARTLARERDGNGWHKVARGQERTFDLVLMRGLVGEGRQTVSAPLHVGCVTERGWMIHIEEVTGVMIQPLTFPTVVNRVIGIYRPEALR